MPLPTITFSKDPTSGDTYWISSDGLQWVTNAKGQTKSGKHPTYWKITDPTNYGVASSTPPAPVGTNTVTPGPVGTNTVTPGPVGTNTVVPAPVATPAAPVATTPTPNPGTGTGTKSRTKYKPIDPFGGRRELLERLGVPKADLYPDDIGEQAGSTLGPQDPAVEEAWRLGNPEFIKQWEASRDRFDPRDKEQMRQYENFHWDFNYKGFYDQLKKESPHMSDDAIKAEATDLANRLSFYGKPGETVNARDQLWGKWHRSRREFKFKDKEIPKAEKTPETPADEPKEDFEPFYNGDRREAPFWLQDVINTAGAVGNRLGLKKYLPWAPQIQTRYPRPSFYDPTRELAANAEQIAIGTQGAGTFSGPQNYNARFSQISGQGAKNAANILSNYHNKNVGIANEFERVRSSIYNRNSELNAASAQKIYDGTAIANQQFDNSKRKANDEIRAQVVNALTNRAQTQTLNTLYPNYNVNPLDGGTTSMVHGTEMQPQSTADSDKEIQDLTSKGYTIDQAVDILELDRGSGRSSRSRRAYDDRYDFLNEYNSQQDAYTTDRRTRSQGYRELGGPISDSFPTALRI